MKKKIIALLTACLFTFAGMLSAQNQIKKAIKNDGDLEYNKKPTIELNPPKEEMKEAVKKKEPKPKPGVYYGMGTKKRMTKKRKGKSIILEKFSILKEYQEPYKFAEYKYIYNPKKKQIERVRRTNKNQEILHGPYKKTVNGEVVEQGIYYVGTKHGRWERYGADMLLLDKRKYYRGLPKDSKITYYDRDQSKVKEIIPIHYGQKEGFYYYYYESGRLAEKGEYKGDQKVGKWYEYYDHKRYTRKKIIQHKRRSTDPDKDPVTIKEWNEKGKVTLDLRKRR